MTGTGTAAFILNNGTIQSQQDPGGIGIGIVSLTSLGTITNSGTGLIQTSGSLGAAVNVAGGLTSLLNSGTIQSSGASGTGVNVVSSGSVGTLTNSTGTIQTSGTLGTVVMIAGGTITALVNNSTIQATGDGGTAIAVGGPGFSGTVGTITNASTASILATGPNGIALDITGLVTTINNQGTISSSNTGGKGVNIRAGAFVASVTNASTGTIQANGSLGTALNVAGGLTTMQNAGTVQANGVSGTAVNVAVGGNIGTMTNAATGMIGASGSLGIGVNVAGNVGTLLNQGQVVASGASGTGVNVVSAGSIGTLNNSGGTIQSTGTLGTAVLIAGSVTTVGNTGKIQSTGNDSSALVIGGSGQAGTITNSVGGTIQATGANGIALDIQGFVTAVNNSGVVQSTGDGGKAVNLGTAALLQNLNNTVTGTIVANGTSASAISVAGALTSILNNGQVNANGASGVAVNLLAGSHLGAVTNDTGGTITANGVGGTGIQANGSVVSITNSSLIQASGTGGTGVAVGTTGTIDGITNNSGGTVIATNVGLAIGGSVGTLSNTGLFQGTVSGVSVLSTGSLTVLNNNSGGTLAATGDGSYGLNVAGNAGTVTNNGLITGPGGAVTLATTGTIGSLVNGGTLLSLTGTAISIGGAGAIPGGITNVAGGLIQGGPSNGSGTAIDLSSSTTPITVTNSGSIIGSVSLTPGSVSVDTVNLNGGTLSGNIVGNYGLNTVNLNGGTIASGFTVSEVFLLNVNSGVLNTGTGGVAINNGFAVDVAQGATLAMNGGTIGLASQPPINGVTPGLNNNGLVNVGTTVGTIASSYSQGATGVLGITVSGTTTGQLAVTGTATIASTGTGVALHFTGPSSITSFFAVTSAGLTDTPLPTASSDSADPWLDNPIASNVGNNLLISFAAPTPGMINTKYQALTAGAAGGFTSTGLRNQLNAILGVQGLVDSLAGNRAVGEGIFNALGSMTQAQMQQFFSQVQPSQVGTAQALLSSALTNNGGLTTSVDNRVYALRNTGGMAAGDEPGRGFTAWARPYGETFTQGVKEDVSGFTASSYGVAIGADTLIRPDFRLGAAISLSNTDISFSGAQSGNTTNDLLAQAGVYGTWFSNGFFVDGIAAFGYNWYNTKENISFFGTQRTSNYTGVQFSTKVTAGYDWHTAGMVVTPSLTFQEIHLNVDAHPTSGAGLFNLNVADQQLDVTQLKLGGRVAYPMTQPSGWSFTPEVHAYYVRNLNISRIATSAAFTSGGAFTVSGPQRDADLANFGLGLTIAQKGPFVLSAVYDYTFGQTTTDNTFFLRVKTEF